MGEELHFNVKDIPSCARHGFSARKIWVFFKTLIMSWAIWNIFIYLGYFAAGYDMAAKWEQSRLFPLPGGLFWEDILPVAFLVIGILLIILNHMRAGLLVSRMTFQKIRGDNFFSGADAARFARTHSLPLVTVPVLLLFSLTIALAAGSAAGLISRIPAVGPVLIAIISIPLWGVMLLAVLTAVALILSVRLLPSIIATTGGDTFESIFELFSTLTSQSWRVFIYWILSMFFAVVGGFVFLIFSSFALDLLAMSTAFGAGEGGFGAALVSGPQLLAPEILPFFSGLVSLGGQGNVESWTGPAGVIAGVSGAAIFMIVLSYIFSSCTSAWTIIYLSLRYRKDGIDLLERADREEQRKFDRLYVEMTDQERTEDSTVDTED